MRPTDRKLHARVNMVYRCKVSKCHGDLLDDCQTRYLYTVDQSSRHVSTEDSFGEQVGTLSIETASQLDR